ncbi:baseplate J/gp47 family protein [Acinetobacter proteolyticus]|nr:baseplate J/gp47 family protein [Acinetobacter proteolyticus]WEI18213.1 baseplate J/gp47 family protein [Acinetobacter proteolyticus]
MAYPIKDFDQIRNLIIQEIRNSTGITAPDDSDAAIRADGEAAVVEGLYHHQSYIQKQLFVETADEPYLYIHAEVLGVPRLGGSLASGQVTASSNVTLTIPAGNKLTDGKGHFWLVVATTELSANTPKTIEVVAEQIGASWNFTGSLLWVSPQAGLSGVATEVSINGGVDGEELEDWRTRMLERKRLGYFRDRSADLEEAVKNFSYVKDIYIYKKRRGLGSVDIAFTVKGNPPMLPTTTQVAEVQALLDSISDHYFDSVAYMPDKEFIDISAVVTGTVDLELVKTTIKNYMAELKPVAEYSYSQLFARILSLAGVTDLVLTPSHNVAPTLDVFHTGWLRLGSLNVTRGT